MNTKPVMPPNNERAYRTVCVTLPLDQVRALGEEAGRRFTSKSAVVRVALARLFARDSNIPPREENNSK